jgi:hypothetical protein
MYTSKIARWHWDFSTFWQVIWQEDETAFWWAKGAHCWFCVGLDGGPRSFSYGFPASSSVRFHGVGGWVKPGQGSTDSAKQKLLSLKSATAKQEFSAYFLQERRPCLDLRPGRRADYGHAMQVSETLPFRQCL